MTVAELREELEKYRDDLKVASIDHEFGDVLEATVAYEHGEYLVLAD